MTPEIEGALERAERALDEGRTLKRTGFWRAVDTCRRDPALAARYADRIGAIDRRAFEAGIKLRVPAAAGLAVLVAGATVGLAAVVIAWSYGQPPPARPVRWVAFDPYGSWWFVPMLFLLGFGLLLVSTHSLTHWIVGRIAGIRFTHVFLGGPPPPRPGVKTDYASYLRASPRARAAMHASGAIVTKVIPFALLALTRDMIRWSGGLSLVLFVVGVLQIVTDVTLSTKTSDWKKVRREFRAARDAKR